jgi:NTP pyrophosphatase (non-canonical NTP hydrolase)
MTLIGKETKLIQSFQEYQEAALETAQYPQFGSNLVYPALKLAGEAGEAADKVGKIWRNQGLTSVTGYSVEQKEALAKEVGDVLWYITALAYELGYGLDQIATGNIEKLRDRRDRGVIKGEGDNR